MINLLPNYYQKKLEDEETTRAIAVLGTVVFAAIMALVLALLLMRVFYNLELKTEQILAAEKEEEMKIYKVEEVEKKIIHNNGLISKVADFYGQQTIVTDIFLETAESIPEGIYLSGFSYSLGKIDLNGFAAKREQLVDFKGRLEQVKSFKNAVFPSENWLTANNIKFRVSFEYGKPE